MYLISSNPFHHLGIVIVGATLAEWKGLALLQLLDQLEIDLSPFRFDSPPGRKPELYFLSFQVESLEREVQHRLSFFFQLFTFIHS